MSLYWLLMFPRWHQLHQPPHTSSQTASFYFSEAVLLHRRMTRRSVGGLGLRGFSLEEPGRWKWCCLRKDGRGRCSQELQGWAKEGEEEEEESQMTSQMSNSAGFWHMRRWPQNQLKPVVLFSFKHFLVLYWKNNALDLFATVIPHWFFFYSCTTGKESWMASLLDYPNMSRGLKMALYKRSSGFCFAVVYYGLCLGRYLRVGNLLPTLLSAVAPLFPFTNTPPPSPSLPPALLASASAFLPSSFTLNNRNMDSVAFCFISLHE